MLKSVLYCHAAAQATRAGAAAACAVSSTASCHHRRATSSYEACCAPSSALVPLRQFRIDFAETQVMLPAADETRDDAVAISDARERAYAARAERQRKVNALDFGTIARGGIFATDAVFTSELVHALHADAMALEAGGQFAPSGLSDTTTRRIFGDSDRCVLVLTPAVEGDREARRQFRRFLDEFRCAAGAALGRSLACSEQYYSVHRRGAFLKRHMDERHEELKGARGWCTSERRSLSWLLYLSQGERSGGELRGYCRCAAAGAHAVGAHEGNLQVGWLSASKSDEDVTPVEPVFMDAWVQGPAVCCPSGAQAADLTSVAVPGVAPAEAAPGQGAESVRPLSALYRVDPRGGREWLTAAFDASAMPPASDDGLSPAARAGAIANELPYDLRRRYCAVSVVPHEGGPPAQVVDVPPAGGTFVLFDSVAIPHEVLPTTAGVRVAMAGWFHEAQRPYPDWFAASTAPHRTAGRAASAD